jgi:hypothetical protein
LIYEKKLNSFPEIMRELSILDLDAGIRAMGKYKAKKCFVFITRSANGFTSLVYSIKSSKKESLPDKRLLAKELPDLKSAEEFLAEIVVKPVKASSY